MVCLCFKWPFQPKCCLNSKLQLVASWLSKLSRKLESFSLWILDLNVRVKVGRLKISKIKSMYLQSQMHGSFSNEPRQSGIPGAALWWSWISWRQTQSHCQTSGQYFSLHFMISNVNVLIPPSWWHCTRPPSGPQCGDHAAATTALHKLFAHSTNNMWGHPGGCADWKQLKTFL